MCPLKIMRSKVEIVPIILLSYRLVKILMTALINFVIPVPLVVLF